MHGPPWTRALVIRITKTSRMGLNGIRYEVRLSSTASDEQLKAWYHIAEQNCPNLSLLRKPQELVAP